MKFKHDTRTVLKNNLRNLLRDKNVRCIFTTRIGVVSVTTCVTNRCCLPSFMEHWQFYNYQANLLRGLETGVRSRILHIRLKQNVFGTAGNKVVYLIRMCNIIQNKHEGVAIASLLQNNARISSHNEITYHGFIGFNLSNV